MTIHLRQSARVRRFIGLQRPLYLLLILQFHARVWELQPVVSVLQTVRNISRIAIVQLTFWKRLVIVYKTTTSITARLFAAQDMMATLPLLANRLESSMVIPVPNVVNNTLRNGHPFQMLLSLVATTNTSRLVSVGLLFQMVAYSFIVVEMAHLLQETIHQIWILVPKGGSTSKESYTTSLLKIPAIYTVAVILIINGVTGAMARMSLVFVRMVLVVLILPRLLRVQVAATVLLSGLARL
mmetsp:Transcript_24443/g.37899  ORF Transcript_24443/g.37899 Transcript_24443/m.37899 type:complete len:240 (+) Transcript_24443:374-1093(+)